MDTKMETLIIEFEVGCQIKQSEKERLIAFRIMQQTKERSGEHTRSMKKKKENVTLAECEFKKPLDTVEDPNSHGGTSHSGLEFNELNCVNVFFCISSPTSTVVTHFLHVGLF